MLETLGIFREIPKIAAETVAWEYAVHIAWQVSIAWGWTSTGHAAGVCDSVQTPV